MRLLAFAFTIVFVWTGPKLVELLPSGSFVVMVVFTHNHFRVT